MTDGNENAGARSRRAFLLGAATAGAAAPLGLAASQVFATPRISVPLIGNPPICKTAAADSAAAATGPLKKITFAWNAGAPCLVGVTVAKEKGFFARNGLDVDLVNYAGSTDQLLETLATGKADAAAGMALRWLKPMEQGFDVKIIASTHGGCLRLLAPTAEEGTEAYIRDFVESYDDLNSYLDLIGRETIKALSQGSSSFLLDPYRRWILPPEDVAGLAAPELAA